MQWCPSGHHRFKNLGCSRRPKLTLSGWVKVQAQLRIICIVLGLTEFAAPRQIKAKVINLFCLHGAVMPICRQ